MNIKQFSLQNIRSSLDQPKIDSIAPEYKQAP